MCGIAGAFDAAGERAAARVSRLNCEQRHRGPDHCVVTHVAGVTLGNTRLAIQDPGPAGNQPFMSVDGRYHCVFNGEVYNHQRLVDRYGLTVRTRCDGEVIPELWAKLGMASLAELRGMFAIALVDSVEGRLYLARDPFGIKPLHWRMLPEGVIFASEVRPLVAVGGPARIDPAAIARYLHLGSLAADQSPFLEITALAPNSVAVFDKDGLVTRNTIRSGGPLAVVGAGDALGDATGLGAALTDSVDLHLGADVPTALLLSSGVDSACIAAASRRLGRDLNCVTIATEGATDESFAASQIARHYGHRFSRVSAAIEEGDVPRFFAAMQRPTVDGLNTFLVAKAVQEAGFKVAVSGLGGDEAVGGYSHFRLLKYLPLLRTLDKLPSSVTAGAATVLARMGVAGDAKLRRLLAPDGPRDSWSLSRLQREVLPKHLVKGLTGTSSDRPDASTGPLAAPLLRPFSAMVAAEVAIYLQATLLPDADSFSMAASVELRVPFVDSHVFAAALDLAVSTRRRPGKQAIGAVLEDSYLKWLATRPKRGFSVPMQAWMAGCLAPVLRAAEAPDAAVWSVVDRRVAARAGMLPLGPAERWSEPWAIAALNAWLEVAG
jgi:asparagine synthase (glutamine-hydrolysing)